MMTTKHGFSLQSGFTKIWCTPNFPLPWKYITNICILMQRTVTNFKNFLVPSVLDARTGSQPKPKVPVKNINLEIEILLVQLINLWTYSKVGVGGKIWHNWPNFKAPCSCQRLKTLNSKDNLKKHLYISLVLCT